MLKYLTLNFDEYLLIRHILNLKNTPDIVNFTIAHDSKSCFKGCGSPELETVSWPVVKWIYNLPVVAHTLRFTMKTNNRDHTCKYCGYYYLVKHNYLIIHNSIRNGWWTFFRLVNAHNSWGYFNTNILDEKMVVLWSVDSFEQTTQRPSKCQLGVTFSIIKDSHKM